MELNPLKTEEKDLKKNANFYPGTKSPFLGPDYCTKFFLAEISIGYKVWKEKEKNKGNTRYQIRGMPVTYSEIIVVN